MIKLGDMSMGMIYMVVMVMVFCFGGNIIVFLIFVFDYFGFCDIFCNYLVIY